MSMPFNGIDGSLLLQSLNEFYLADTPNFRKREIETQLIAFKQHANFTTLQLCLKEAVTFENNQLLWFFCTNVLSHTITRRWTQKDLSPADRALIRDTLWNAYANLPTNGVKLRRDTTATLIAQIGKREFPDDHNYFLHLFELIKANFFLGINLLRITFEECNREDLTTDRKKYFNTCASVYTPQIVDLITKYLLIAVCHVNNKDILSALGSLPVELTTEIHVLAPTLPKNNQLSSSLLELLHCAQQLISWNLMNTDFISDIFLMSIIDLAKYRTELHDCSFAALGVINEILYLQKPIPGVKAFITGICDLLAQNNLVKPQNEMYVDKFRELLRLFTLKYWQKMFLEDNASFEGFLNALYLFTIQKNGALELTEKLEIWTPIVKGLVNKGKPSRYNDIFLQVVSEIMQRMQFEFNKTELELLENEIIDENAQTEWQQFLTQCIEFISLVAEAEANTLLVFGHIAERWLRFYTFLTDCEKDYENGKSFELSRKLNSNQFGENLKDFSTICQALARIAPNLEFAENHCDSFSNKSNVQVDSWADSLLCVLKFFTRNKLNVNKTHLCDYNYLFAQVLMAIRSLLVLPICLKNDNFQQILLIELGNIFQPGKTYSPIVYMSASQLLLCITSLIRSKNFLETPSIMALMQMGPNLGHLPPRVVANIYTTFISYLLLPWKNVENGEQQDYQRREYVCREYVSSLSQSLLDIETEKTTSVSNEALEQVANFSEVLSFFKDASSASKEMLAVSFKPIITKTLILYNFLGTDDNKVSTVVAEFSLSALRTFSFSQLGAQFIQNMIELFITVNNRQKLSAANYLALEKILQMFQIIVEQPGTAPSALLPSMIDFTIQNILPLIQDNASNSSNMANAVYVLIDGILTFKWQYFYKSTIQLNGSLSTLISGDNLHADHFTALMTAYGQALVSSSDPNLVRQVLQSMQNLNERWRLFQRPLFKENLLNSFQQALITMLLSDQGALHFDLLTALLFAMGQVDTLKLRERFMTAGFPVNSKIIDEICLSTDIPTFSQKLTQLIHDVHCVSYRN